MHLEWNSGASSFWPVGLFVAKHFNHRHNFLTIRDKDFIYGMDNLLIKHFRMTPGLITLWP